MLSFTIHDQRNSQLSLWAFFITIRSINGGRADAKRVCPKRTQKEPTIRSMADWISTSSRPVPAAEKAGQ
jgi:hypothetical protein